MKADTVESVYQSLPGGNAASSRPESVNEFLTEFIRPTSDAEKVIKALKPVHVDKMNVFVTEEAKKEKRILKTKKRDPKLTAREKRRLKIYEIPKEAHKYELFMPLSALWQEYMEKLLKQGTQNFEQKLIKADFHGAPFTVIQSTNPSYVGVSGIIVQETLSMFKIITKEDKLKQIPKNSTIFTIKIKKNEKQQEKDYVLYGQQFVSRPSERAVKKFKPKPSINM